MKIIVKTSPNNEVVEHDVPIRGAVVIRGFDGETQTEKEAAFLKVLVRSESEIQIWMDLTQLKFVQEREEELMKILKSKL